MEELANESLTKVEKMAEEMGGGIDILETQCDDLIGMYQQKEEELKNEIEILECKTDCLEHQLRDLTRDNAELHHEADRNRAYATQFQLAVSVIIFAYGWLYGSLSCSA
jgi:hypothetical protein